MSKMSQGEPVDDEEPVFNKRLRDSLAAPIIIEIPLCFTADDVAALRALSDMDLHERSCATSGKLPFPCDCDVPERIMALESIADRIAALLPPTP